jgi:hypothetical protein
MTLFGRAGRGGVHPDPTGFVLPAASHGEAAPLIPLLSPGRAAAVAFVLLLTLAAVAHPSASTSHAPTFSAPVPIGAGAEPSIQVAPGGSPYYVESAHEIWRSTDKGASWTRITPVQVFSGDANAAVGSTGNLYYQSLWIGSSWAWTSLDQGASWPVQNAFSTAPVVDRNWIAAYGPSTVYAKADLFGSPVQTPLIHRSTDAGLTYLPTAGIIDGALSTSGGVKGALTVDQDDGTLYLPADRATNVVTSIDGGDNLRVAPVPNPNGPSYDIILTVSVDSAGNAYLAWISQHANKWTLQYSYSTNKGLTWSTPNVVATAGGASRVFPWSAANGTGNLAIAWYETTSSSAGPDNVPNNTPWSVRVAHVTNAASATPTVTLANVTGTIHVGKICTSGVTCASGTRNLLDFLGIAIDPTDGKTLVVYTDDTSGTPTIKIARQNGGQTL